MHPKKSPFCRQFFPRFLACLFKQGLVSAAQATIGASMLALRTGVKIIDFLWHSSFATTSQYNDFPVAIVDLGMSAKMRKWCEKRGTVILLNESCQFCAHGL